MPGPAGRPASTQREDDPMIRPLTTPRLPVLLTLVAVALTIGLTSCGGGSDPVTPPSENTAPTAPAIDTAGGAPADGATNVDDSVILRWTCTDADGDDLTYTVRLGTTSPPPSVSTSQAGLSYDPASLDEGATYYWQIVASDGTDTTASPVWSFTVEAAPAETVSTPSTPAGPANPETDTSVEYVSSAAASSEGHDVEYRFDWGDGTYSDWTAAVGGLGRADRTWPMAGTFEVKAQARCADHTGIVSDWSNALTVTVVGPEAITTPDAPDGPTEGETFTSMRYDVTGAVNSNGHDLSYRFDWGAGVITAWTNNEWGATQWVAAGVYEVRVQARCQTHIDVLSEWSPATTVTISDPAETVTVPSHLNGPETGLADESLTFSTYGAGTNLGHQVEYRFDWGDGSISEWTPPTTGSTSLSHAWTAAGTYDVSSQARCIEHPDAVSDWRTPVSIEIMAEETVSPPSFNGDQEVWVDIGGWYVPSLIGASSSTGHTLEYYVEWGDGTIRDWSVNWSLSKRWDVEGDFTARARARCQDHPDVVSDWGPSVTLHVQELESIDGWPVLNGSNTATVGVPSYFTVTGVSSSMGHELEYQLYDSYNESVPGTPQGWVAMEDLSMTWASPGVRVLKVRARCAAHPDVESIDSQPFVVTISE